MSSLSEIKQYKLLQVIKLVLELKTNNVNLKLRIESYSPVIEHADERLEEFKYFLLKHGLNENIFYSSKNTGNENIHNKKKAFWIKITPVFNDLPISTPAD